MRVMNRPGKTVRRASRWRLPCVALLACVAALARAQQPTAPPAAGGAAAARHASASPPADLRDVGAWVAWKNGQQLVALPTEARLFYRRGLIARQSGQYPEALANVRGAIDLDPSFLAPHLTLAGWFMFTDPAQTLLHCAVIVDRIRRDFTVQLDVAANVLGLGIEALFVGLLFAGL